jgi:hypothetical protein
MKGESFIRHVAESIAKVNHVGKNGAVTATENIFLRDASQHTSHILLQYSRHINLLSITYYLFLFGNSGF